MEYHTSLPHLILPEYGRNIQRMVDFAVTVQDKEERNRVAQAIIYVMGQLNPHLRDVADFKHKLWDHLYIISDFKLDVESPYPKPSKETFQTKPEKVAYPAHHIKYRHYGNTVERLIEKAATYSEGEEKDALIASIANLMKRCYLTWNQETVEDVVIFQQLEELSKGKLKVSESFKFVNTQDILASNKKRPQGRNDRKERDNGGRNRNNNNRFHKRKY